MAPSIENLSRENPLFQVYAFYISILSLKMLFMSILTSYNRIKTGAVASPEDAGLSKNPTFGPNENVERVRRAHRNDVENIPIFMFISFLYILTNPNAFIASMLFRIYTVARIVHTIGYCFLASHKPRGMGWATGFFITIYMAVQLALTCYESG